MTLKIKNWKRFQHFKDRRPPWIKFYRDLLDDIEWHELDPAAAKTLVMFWLIASEDETQQGILPCDKELAFRLRTTEKAIDSIIPKLAHWLDGDDIRLIQAEHQADSAETEESRKAVEAEEPPSPKKTAPIFTLPESIRPEVWKAFEDHRKKKRSPMTVHAKDLIVRECMKLGGDPNELLEQSIRKGWLDVFPLKDQPNGGPPPAAPEPKPPPIPKMCHCGKPATTVIGGEPECDECIQGTTAPAPARRRAAIAPASP